jgi:hypothetical protein
LFATVVLIAAVAGMPPVLAQSGGHVVIPGKDLSVPEYEVDGDGILTIGGDVVVPCKDLANWDVPMSATSSARTAAERSKQEAINACAEAGFPPEERDTSASAMSNASSTVVDSSALPETGGGLYLPALLGVGAFVAALALWTLRVS